jgi:hypothetical protein
MHVYANCCENADIAAKIRNAWAFEPPGTCTQSLVGRMAIMRAPNPEKTAPVKTACSRRGIVAFTRQPSHGEAGCSGNEIMAISGHATLKELVRYTAAADQARLARNAMGRTAQAM